MRHIGIVVKNIEAAIDFWREMFGYEIEIDQKEVGAEIDKLLAREGIEVRTVKMVHDSFSRVELLHFEVPPIEKRSIPTPFSQGITHLAFTVPNLEQYLKRLQNLGGGIIGITHSIDGGIEVAYCYGVEGILLELVEIKERSTS